MNRLTALSIAAAVSGLSAVSAVQAQSATYNIDPTHTQVMFEARHLGLSLNRGRWDKKEGTITLDKAAKTGRVEITIDMASINTGIGPFDNHLRGADFFEVTAHPTAKFVGTNFKFDGDKVSEVTGELTLKGKTAPVTLKSSFFGCTMHPRLQREVCGGDFETTITRSQWGVTWGIANNAVPDATRLVIQVEGIKAQ